MATIALEGMRFFGFHGVYAEERKLGGFYEVDVYIQTNTMAAALSDKVADALNYETVYLICQAEMRQSTHLIEALQLRIIQGIKKQFYGMAGITVKVTKLNPPLPGPVTCASIESDAVFAKKCGRCGKGIICYSDGSCACGNHELPSKTQEMLKAEFGGCLCYNCLEFYRQ